MVVEPGARPALNDLRLCTSGLEAELLRLQLVTTTVHEDFVEARHVALLPVLTLHEARVLSGHALELHDLLDFDAVPLGGELEGELHIARHPRNKATLQELANRRVLVLGERRNIPPQASVERLREHLAVIPVETGVAKRIQDHVLKFTGEVRCGTAERHRDLNKGTFLRH